MDRSPTGCDRPCERGAHRFRSRRNRPPHALDAATADRGNALTELAQRGDHTLAHPSRLNANRSRGPPPLPPMKRLPSLPTLVIAPPALHLPPLARAAAIPFAPETSDLQPDPPSVSARPPPASALRSSPSRRPRRASLRLLAEAGSFHEQDDPRGHAHFREHLAFDGSQNYQPGSLVELLQRLGMKFGADIVREKRTRDSIQSRVSDARLAFAFATTFFPKRLPIGRAEIISTAPPSASSISGTPGIAPSTWPSSSWATSPSPSSRN